jgi:hypothetical protein
MELKRQCGTSQLQNVIYPKFVSDRIRLWPQRFTSSERLLQSRWICGQLTLTHTRTEKLCVPGSTPGGSEMNAPARSSCLSLQNCRVRMRSRTGGKRVSSCVRVYRSSTTRPPARTHAPSHSRPNKRESGALAHASRTKTAF